MCISSGAYLPVHYGASVMVAKEGDTVDQGEGTGVSVASTDLLFEGFCTSQARVERHRRTTWPA